MQQNVQPSKEQQENKKQSYEKPKLGSVALVADQVLRCVDTGLGCDQQTSVRFPS